HLHQNASCAPQKKGKKWISGGAAGGHYDPAATNQHSSPSALGGGGARVACGVIN
ncbi:MAG: Cu-Zn family superoxide dismutase, partial [Patiriisocius sp.]